MVAELLAFVRLVAVEQAVCRRRAGMRQPLPAHNTHQAGQRRQAREHRWQKAGLGIPAKSKQKS